MTEIPVLVTIQSCARRDDGSEEPISLMTAGTLSLDEETAVVTYQEIIDESIPPQTVIVTAKEDMVTMQREGDYATQMVFRRGQRYEGVYQTPFGSMDMAIFCTRLHYDLAEEGGEVLLAYQLDMNGQFAGMHRMHMQVMVKNG
jgi:uncharacterized beta-barrel protein YwiB (DUF1934 family)